MIWALSFLARVGFETLFLINGFLIEKKSVTVFPFNENKWNMPNHCIFCNQWDKKKIYFWIPIDDIYHQMEFKIIFLKNNFPPSQGKRHKAKGLSYEIQLAKNKSYVSNILDFVGLTPQKNELSVRGRFCASGLQLRARS